MILGSPAAAVGTMAAAIPHSLNIRVHCKIALEKNTEGRSLKGVPIGKAMIGISLAVLFTGNGIPTIVLSKKQPGRSGEIPHLLQGPDRPGPRHGKAGRRL